jgi:hypothetical protein
VVNGRLQRQILCADFVEAADDTVLEDRHNHNVPAGRRKLKARLLPLPACGERVGVRGSVEKLRIAASPPHPLAFALRASAGRPSGQARGQALSPQAGRGRGVPHLPHIANHRPVAASKKVPASNPRPLLGSEDSCFYEHKCRAMRRAHSETQ